METLVLDGKTFVKASKAARDLGYTSDYVGQLCRGGKITSHLVGRTWYVDISQLGEHRVEKKRMSRVKAREQAHKAIEEHKLRVQSTEEKTESRVRYEEDESDLIPAVRKLEINEHMHAEPKQYAGHRDEPVEEPFSIENKGKKIIMAGKLKVVDLSDEIAADPDIVTLHARINRKVHKKEDIPVEEEVENEDEHTEIEESVVETESNEEPRQYINFTDRIKRLEEESAEVIESNGEMLSGLVPPQRKQSSIWYVLFVLTMLVLTTLSLAVDAKWTLTNEAQKGEGVIFDSNFGFDIMGTVSKISERI